MDNLPEIMPIRDRRYQEIPVDKVKVINSRNRDKEQFDMNIESIDNTGLLKPIRVNDKFLERNGVYELICGEGRLLAHQKLGRETVMAEVVTCTRKEAYLQSLVENIARAKPDSLDFTQARKIVTSRARDNKKKDSSKNYTVGQLKHEIAEATRPGVERNGEAGPTQKTVRASCKQPVKRRPPNAKRLLFHRGTITACNAADAHTQAISLQMSRKQRSGV